MNSEPVLIDDDDVVIDENSAAELDDDVKIIEQKPASPIVIEDEPQTNEAKDGFVRNLRNNDLMDKIVNTCMNMQNAVGIQRVIQKTLIPLYKDTDPKLKESRTLTKVLKNTHKLLLRDPDYKFLHLKTLCEHLKSGRLRKKLPFVTLATTLQDNDKHSDSSDDQTESNEKRDEPNTNNTTTEVEKTIEVEILGVPRLKKRKPKNIEDEIQGLPRPKKRKQKIKPKKGGNKSNVNKKTDVIVLDNSDDESGNLDGGNNRNKTINQEATTENNVSQRKSHNNSAGEDPNKENNGSKTEQEKETNKQLDKKNTTYCNVPMNINSEQNPQPPMNSTAMQNPQLPMNSTAMQTPQLPINSTAMQTPQLHINSTTIQNSLSINGSLMQNPRLPINSTSIQNQLSINSTAFQNPQFPTFTLIQNPQLPLNSNPVLHSFLDPRLFTNIMPMIHNVPEDDKISKTVAVIEYNASQDVTKVQPEDGMDLEAFIPQTHIENQCQVSDDTSNTKDICSNNQSYRSIVNEIIQKDLVPNKPGDNRMLRDLLLSVSPMGPTNRKVNEIVQCPSDPKNSRENEMCHLDPKNPRENEIVEDLLVPKNHIDAVILDDVPYVNENPEIAFHELCIARYKKELAILEEMEVTSDHHLHSPYLKCARVKERILKTYKKICKIKGSSAQVAKRCEIRLNVAQGHHPGPAKRLEKFLNSTIGADGLVKFPDFHDVMTCVFKSNYEDDLGWNNTEIFKEASALFVKCGQTLRKRRQKREYKDLMSLVRDKELADDDPADRDPLLLAKLEQNKIIAKHNENELINRFAAMENMRYTGHGGNNTVEFQSDGDSSSDSADDSADSEDKSPANEIESIQNTQDITSHAEDKINLKCTQLSLVGIFLGEQSLEHTNNNKSVTNVSPSEHSASLNSSSKCRPVNNNLVEGATKETESSQINVENSTSNTAEAESLVTNVTDKEVASKDSNCEKANIKQENIDVNSIKQEKESIKINFSEPIDSVSYMHNYSSASTSTDVKIETTIKPERLDIQTMFTKWSDNYECTVFDIEDPFLVIEISSDEDSDDDL